MSSYTQRRKAQIHSLLGGKCKHCGEKDTRVLQIDHVYGDGAEERRGGLSRMQLYRNVVNNTKRYQLLCANCNWKKREKDFKRNRKMVNRPIRDTLVRFALIFTSFLFIYILWEISL